MVHTVFVNNRRIRFADAYEADQWKGKTKSLFVTDKSMSIIEAINEMEKNDVHPGYIYLTATPDAAWQIFVSYCTLIEASGGLVTNEKGEYLMIFRKKKWDLPKGKIEYDESPEMTAIREVQEECGLKQVEIIQPLKKTFHTYFENKKRILKKTNWYLMKSADKKLTPQATEDIAKAKWMSKDEISKEVLKNTYSSVAELLKGSLQFKFL